MPLGTSWTNICCALLVLALAIGLPFYYSGVTTSWDWLQEASGSLLENHEKRVWAAIVFTWAAFVVFARALVREHREQLRELRQLVVAAQHQRMIGLVDASSETARSSVSDGTPGAGANPRG